MFHRFLTTLYAVERVVIRVRCEHHTLQPNFSKKHRKIRIAHIDFADIIDPQ